MSRKGQNPNKKKDKKRTTPKHEARNRAERRRNKNAGRDEKRRHIPESLRQYVTGTVDMKSTGKAYVMPDNRDLDDILITPNNTGRALHGDYVRVLIFPSRSGRRLEGQIVEVLKRTRKNFVGTLEFSGKFAFLVPDSANLPDVLLDKDNLHKGKRGEKVVVRITDWPQHMKNPVGEIVEVLGAPGDNNVEMQSILAEFDFPLSYPKEAEKEAAKMTGKITAQELKKRRDFRDIYTCTIDPADAKDFDDALSYRKLPNGNIEAGVHIADVSHFVKPGSKIDDEAYERATSVYLVDRTIPMLPEKLCNDLCSLKPDVDRYTFSVVFEMTPDAQIKDIWLGKGIIHSNRRFTYEEAQAIIEAKVKRTSVRKSRTDFSPFKKNDKEAVLALYELSKILREKRFTKGAINFETPEVKFKLDPETAKPLGVYIKESKESNHLVEEFMLLANKKVAEFVGKKRPAKTFVYRVHDEPNPEKMQNFSQFVAKLGYKMNLGTRAGVIKSYNNLLDAVKGKAEQNMIEQIAVRTMAKAVYTTDNIGHYGLAFPYYTHFTSPIRRYPDLMVHRLLQSYLEGGKSADAGLYETFCEHSSDMERRAAEAERMSVKYKQAEYLSDKIGEKFAGSISGVSKYGIYVCLDENYCEGMVPLRTLTDDYYELDEENYQVVGLRTGTVYKLGQRVRIRVQDIDMSKKQLTFCFAK